MHVIGIVGAGALGSHVALFGRNWTVMKSTLGGTSKYEMRHVIKVVDFDRVEQKNVLAQFHTKMGLRKNKALGIKQAMQGMFGVHISATPHKLTEGNLTEILNECSIIIDCTDNIAARTLIQGWALKTGVPTLHGALSADGTFARILWTEHFTADAEGADGEATCEDGENLPLFALAAAQVACVAQDFLKTGRKRSYQMMPGVITRLA